MDEVSGREVATLVKTMTVHFDSNGGTPSDIADIETAEGKAYGTYGAWPSDPSREGYVFAGWKDSEDVVTSSTIVTRTADHTLTAIWTPNTYSIVYNANTGIGTSKYNGNIWHRHNITKHRSRNNKDRIYSKRLVNRF